MGFRDVSYETGDRIRTIVLWSGDADCADASGNFIFQNYIVRGKYRGGIRPVLQMLSQNACCLQRAAMVGNLDTFLNGKGEICAGKEKLFF